MPHKSERGIAPLIIILIIIGLGVISTSAIVISNTVLKNNEPKDSSAGAPRETTSQTSTANQSARPNKTPKPTKTPKPGTGTVKEESGTTITGWSYTGFRDIIVTPSTRTDEKAIKIKFERNNFANISEVYYNLNYDIDESGVKKGAEGSFNPTKEAQATSTIGRSITKEVILGTCSKGVCTFHGNPRNFKLEVRSTRTGGAPYSQTLTKPSL